MAILDRYDELGITKKMNYPQLMTQDLLRKFAKGTQPRILYAMFC